MIKSNSVFFPIRKNKFSHKSNNLSHLLIIIFNKFLANSEIFRYFLLHFLFHSNVFNGSNDNFLNVSHILSTLINMWKFKIFSELCYDSWNWFNNVNHVAQSILYKLNNLSLVWHESHGLLIDTYFENSCFSLLSHLLK